MAVGSRVQFDRLADVVTAHRVRPVIDRVFAFEDAAAAFGHHESAGPFGKVVIAVRDH